MKSVYTAFVCFVLGMILLVAMIVSLQFNSVSEAISFELRNGLMEASEEAMIPREVCEIEACTLEEKDIEGLCDEDGFKENCHDEYMEEEEYFTLLCSIMKNYKLDSYGRDVDLLYFQNDPLLVKARIRVKEGIFRFFPLIKEEVVIEE